MPKLLPVCRAARSGPDPAFLNLPLIGKRKSERKRLIVIPFSRRGIEPPRDRLYGREERENDVLFFFFFFFSSRLHGIQRSGGE